MKGWIAAIGAGLALAAGLAQARDTGATGATAPSADDRAPAKFAKLCADCHGPRGAGAVGPTIIGPIWRHGSDDASMIRSIREGYPELGMPRFAEALSDPEITDIVDYLRAQRAAAGRAATGSLGQLPPGAIPRGTVRTAAESFRVERVAKAPQPYGVAFLPDGRILVTQITGQLRIIENGRLLPEPVAGTPTGPAPQDSFRRVLMDVEAHPNVRENGWIYLTSAEALPGKDEDGIRLTLTRGRIRDGRWVDSQTLAQVLTQNSSAGRIAFDGRGHLFLGTVAARYPEAEPERHAAQDLGDTRGKILRLREDGGVPPDNPFVGVQGAFPYVWSYGHREPLGLALDNEGRLWESEDGPRGGDELNLIRAGRNYGWPVITWGHRYDEKHVPARPEREGMEQPVVSWVPSPALSVAHFYTGDAFPNWRNSLFIGSLKMRSLLRIILDGERATLQETVLFNLDRIRDIETGPDGCLYLLTDGGDLLRLVPAGDGAVQRAAAPAGPGR